MPVTQPGWALVMLACPLLWLLQGGVRGMRDGWWCLRRKASQPWDKAGGGRIEMKVQFRPYNA